MCTLQVHSAYAYIRQNGNFAIRKPTLLKACCNMNASNALLTPYEECQPMLKKKHGLTAKYPTDTKFICYVTFILTILIIIGVGILQLFADPLSKPKFYEAVPLNDQGQPKMKTILMIGGTVHRGEYLRSTLSFDPSQAGKMAYLEKAELQSGRAGHVAAKFGHTIVVTGGLQQLMAGSIQQRSPTSLTEIMVMKNATQFSLSVGHPANQKRMWTSGVVHGNELLICGALIIGGIGSCEKYSPVKNKWTNDIPVIPQNRRVYKGPMVALGKYIYLFSPNENSNTRSAMSTLRYDTLDKVWEERAPMKEVRIDSAASVCIQQGGITVIVVCGGYVCYDTCNTLQSKSSCELYNPETDIWSSFSEMLVKRAGHALVNWHGILLAIGGFPGDEKSETTDTIEQFNGTNSKWAIIHAKLPQDGRAEFATVLL